jgi:hypothetical protein
MLQAYVAATYRYTYSDIEEYQILYVYWNCLNYYVGPIYSTDKGKAVPLHAMEAHGVRGGIAPAHS